jgi:phosphoribosylanthranilate isomerase
MTGQHQKAYELIMDHRFHPWEGGEGKITTQYTMALVELAKAELAKQDGKSAEDYLQKALVYPENLGEAVRIARPDAVDVSSGVETAPGIKDPFKVRRLMALARSLNRNE